MNTTIRTLQCFLVLVECQNYTKAAERLFITQPALTKMIQRLEEQLGAPLLIRSNKGIKPTSAGWRLQRSALDIVENWQQLDHDLAGLNSLKSGNLKLGLCPMIGSMLIETTARYIQDYPGISLNIQELGGFHCEHAILEGKQDLAFSALPVSNYEQLSSKRLLSFPLMACLPNNHPLAAQQTLQWTDLDEQPMIQYSDDYSLAQLIQRRLRHHKISPKVVSRSGQWDCIGAMVAQGLGIALLPDPISKRLTETDICVRPLFPQINWDIALIWHRSSTLSPAAEAMVALSQRLAGHHSTPTP